MTKKRTTTPSMKDILKLPCWARVAFAARCARRVQPLFDAWKGATRAYKDAVDKAITLSEASARAGRAVGSAREVAAAESEAAALFSDPDAFYDAANSDSGTRADGDLVSAASEAAASAAYGTGVYDAVAAASGHAASAAGTAEAAAVAAAAYFRDFADGAAEAAKAAAEFAARAADAAEAAARAAIWSDYDRLLALAAAEAWDDDTPVDVNRLGPL